MTKRVLLVEGEHSIRAALEKVLRDENYEVLLGETGPEATARYSAGRVDLLLLDLNLPGGNGWATLEWLTRVNLLVPLIIITGCCHERELAEKAGADALMEKPLDVPLLLRTIRELLDETRESRALRASQRPAPLKCVPCDDQRFRQMLMDRFTVPYGLTRANGALRRGHRI
jgi:DNA-binding response OmpR family regulator